MVDTVVMEHHWTPITIDNLYIDDIDYHGLVYWYNLSVKQHKKINGS